MSAYGRDPAVSTFAFWLRLPERRDRKQFAIPVAPAEWFKEEQYRISPDGTCDADSMHADQANSRWWSGYVFPEADVSYPEL